MASFIFSVYFLIFCVFCFRKKVATDPRLSGKQKSSNTIWYISKDTNKDQLTVPPPGVTSLHHAATANMALVQMDKENQAEVCLHATESQVITSQTASNCLCPSLWPSGIGSRLGRNRL